MVSSALPLKDPQHTQRATLDLRNSDANGPTSSFFIGLSTDAFRFDCLYSHGQHQYVHFCSSQFASNLGVFASEALPNYELYHHRLAKGWLPGQWHRNCESCFLGSSCVYPRVLRTTAMHITALFATISRPSQRLWPPFWLKICLHATYPAILVSPTNNLHGVPFHLIFSLIILTVIQGVSVLKALIIFSVNYALAKATSDCSGHVNFQ